VLGSPLAPGVVAEARDPEVPPHSGDEPRGAGTQGAKGVLRRSRGRVPTIPLVRPAPLSGLPPTFGPHARSPVLWGGVTPTVFGLVRGLPPSAGSKGRTADDRSERTLGLRRASRPQQPTPQGQATTILATKSWPRLGFCCWGLWGQGDRTSNPRGARDGTRAEADQREQCAAGAVTRAGTTAKRRESRERQGRPGAVKRWARGGEVGPWVT
jgi:hypothetical protein